MAQNNYSVPSVNILMILVLLACSAGCTNSDQFIHSTLKPIKIHNVTESEINTSYINFRSFQNSDMSWGFTIFINNIPYRCYNRIPVSDMTEGFASRKEAENVALIFIKMIQSGDLSPQLNKRSLDTLGITIKKKRKMTYS